MKLFKSLRLPSAALAAAMLLSSLFVLPASAEGASDDAPAKSPAITLSTTDKATPGSTVNVKVTAVDFDEVYGIDLLINTPEAVTLTSSDVKTNWESDTYEVDNCTLDVKDHAIHLVATGAMNVNTPVPFVTTIGTNELLSFSFTVPENAVAGETSYTFSFANDTKVRFCTSSEDEVAVATSPLTVTVESAECEHDWEFTAVVKQPTITEAGEKTVTCSKCHKTATEAIALPVKNAQVQFLTDIVLQESIAIRIRRLNSQLTGNGYSGFFIKVDYDCFKPALKYNKASDTTIIEMSDFEPLNASIDKAMLSCQAVFDITQQLNAVAYFTDANGVVVAYNDFMSTTVKDKLLALYQDSKTTDKTKTQIVDLVNYAEAARLYFADSNKTSDMAKIEPINKDFSGYSGSTQTEFEYNKTNTATKGYEKAQILTDYVIGAANDIRFRVGVYTNKVDPSELSVKFRYTDGYKNTEVATEKLPVTDLELAANSATMKIYKYIFSLALYDMNKVATAEIYEAGNENPVYTIDYCLESFVYDYLDPNGSKYAETNQVTKELLNAAMRFSASSRAAFNIK